MSAVFVTTRQQRFACARLPDPHLTPRRMPFPRSLTTTVFSQRSTRRFEASPRRATPKGHFLHLPNSIINHESAPTASDSLRCSALCEADTLEVVLVNARHVKRVPGRKTDVKDSEWLAQLLECGLLRPSFVPPPPIRELRDLTRYRVQQLQDRTQEVNRLCKVLEDAGVKLTSVVSDVMGVSGRAMIAALVEGTTDPVVLADLARGRLRKKLPELQRALQGRFRTHHAFLIQQIFAKIDFLDETLDRVTGEIDRRLLPFEPTMALLDTIPGVDRTGAMILIAETGGDMRRFPSDAHLCSWAALCPGQNESAGKRRSGATRHGNRYLRGTLIQCALAATRKQ